MRKVLIFLALVSSRFVAPQLQISQVFRRVASSMPAVIDSCRVNGIGGIQVARHSSPRLACAALCRQQPDCLLYCIKGNECSLFNAKVTVRWAGDKSTNALNYDECFSSWSPAVNDLTHLINIANIDGIEPAANRDKENVVNGFYCHYSGNGHDGFCFTTNWETQPWWMADLGTPTSISTIILSGFDMWHSSVPATSYTVQITLGDSTDHTNNAAFGGYISADIQGDTVYFNQSPPLKGRYLRIQLEIPDGGGNFHFCDILLLG